MPPWTDANPSLKVATVGVAPSHCPRPVYALCAFHGTTAEPNVHYLVWRGRGGAKNRSHIGLPQVYCGGHMLLLI